MGVISVVFYKNYGEIINKYKNIGEIRGKIFMLTSYPRPQLKRDNWENLNGKWKFAFDDAEKGMRDRWFEKFPEDCMNIEVPYTYETKLSGIGIEEPHSIVWYSRTFNAAAGKGRTIINFDGVDYTAVVFINGVYAGSHTGGYSRFSFDITGLVKDGANDITVRVSDSFSNTQPRGKQRWKSENFGCWYVQTTGIWKSVWLEEVPALYVKELKITPDVDAEEVRISGRLSKKVENAVIKAGVSFEGEKITEASLSTEKEFFEMTVSVRDTEAPWGVRLWAPEHPHLYSLDLKVFEEKDPEATDSISSYFGMRKIEIKGDRILLNNEDLYQRLILDQGYFSESHLTFPSDEAFEKEVRLIKEAGYNGLRKHEKVEDERFIYECDRQGMLMWCEMPSTYAFNDTAVNEFTRQWMEIVMQNYNHPSIITWTAFNESWGVEKILTDKFQQEFTEGIYHLTKAFDGMRPVIVNDGWEHTVSDILTLHDYVEAGAEFTERYSREDDIKGNKILFNKGKFAFARGYEYKGQPVIISEYGGIAYSAESGWGYGKMVANEEEFISRFEKITTAIKDLPYACGFCYTQVTDVQQEINGLYKEDRTPKVDIARISAINTR